MPNTDPFDLPFFGTGDTAASATVATVSNMPVVRSIDVKGGHKQVADIAARDAIGGDGVARDDAAQFRQEGMRCWVASTGQTFQLIGGVDNANWVDVTSSASVGAKTRNSDDTGTIEIGSVLAQSPTTARRVQRTTPAANDALSRPVGISTVQQAVQGNAVTLQTSAGEEVPVRLVAGLAPALGEEIVLSTVLGEGTIPGSAISEPTSGQELQRVGIILDALTYGGADRLVLCQVDFGHRRTVS